MPRFWRYCYIFAGILLAALVVMAVEYGSDAIVFTANTSTLTMTGDATVWDDIRVSPANLTPGVANAPTWTTVVGNVGAYLFATNDYLDFEVQCPHWVMEDSSLDAHVHTGGDGTDGDGGDIKWSIECAWADIDGAFSSTATLTSDNLAVSGTDEHKYLDVGTFTNATHGINDTPSTIGLCRVKRVAGTDDYDGGAESVWLWSVDFHAERDKIGSRTEDAW